MIDASEDDEDDDPTPIVLKNSSEPQSDESDDNKSKTSKKRRVLIDRSNVVIAYSYSVLGKKFDKKNGDAFSAEGLKICLEYFEKMGFDAKATIPNFRLKKYNSSNPQLLKDLLDDGKLIAIASKAHEDGILLESALQLDAAVVSNDYFRRFYLNYIFFY